MTAFVIAVVYLVLGSGAGVAVAVQKRKVGPVGGPGSVILVVFLWPFLLPTTMLGESAPSSRSESAAATKRAIRIDRLVESVRAVPDGTGACRGRERSVLEGFLLRLRAGEQRLRDMDEAIDTVPDNVQSKLRSLRDRSARDIDQGCALVEEVVAQLTLLRFVDGSDTSAATSERDRVEHLLASIETLASLSQPVEESTEESALQAAAQPTRVAV